MPRHHQPTTTGADHFNSVGSSYAEFVAQDPVRNILHYPTVISQLGTALSGSILDVGCGDGYFGELLSREYGTKVTGYDNAPDLIQIAVERHDTSGNTNYHVASPENFPSIGHYQAATSVMVLPYSPDEQYLERFFATTYRDLLPGSSFISIVFNPAFSSFGERIINRTFTSLENGGVMVSFLSPLDNSSVFTSKLIQFSTSTYENAAANAGFFTDEVGKSPALKRGFDYLQLE